MVKESRTWVFEFLGSCLEKGAPSSPSHPICFTLDLHCLFDALVPSSLISISSTTQTSASHGVFLESISILCAALRHLVDESLKRFQRFPRLTIASTTPLALPGFQALIFNPSSLVNLRPPAPAPSLVFLPGPPKDIIDR